MFAAAAVADGFMCFHMLEQRAEHYKMNTQKKKTTSNSECSKGKNEKKNEKNNNSNSNGRKHNLTDASVIQCVSRVGEM